MLVPGFPLCFCCTILRSFPFFTYSKSHLKKKNVNFYYLRLWISQYLQGRNLEEERKVPYVWQYLGLRRLILRESPLSNSLSNCFNIVAEKCL